MIVAIPNANQTFRESPLARLAAGRIGDSARVFYQIFWLGADSPKRRPIPRAWLEEADGRQ
jgi:hypothetical protein